MSASITSMRNICRMRRISFFRLGLTNRILRDVSGSMNGEMAFPRRGGSGGDAPVHTATASRSGSDLAGC